VRQAIVAGVTSGIGSALAGHLSGNGWAVAGTSREPVSLSLRNDVLRTVVCDFACKDSIARASMELVDLTTPWDLLVLAPGSMVPIGTFESVDFEAWSKSFHVNLIGQLQFVHQLLRHANRSTDEPPLCLFFAGGGVNSAPASYSAYVVARIALIKATEMLDAEISDITFAILGPGWVRTKIHEQTLFSEQAPDSIVEETRRRLDADDFVPMAKVLDAIDWLINQPKYVVGGRNFSAAGDAFGDKALISLLLDTRDAFRLRRANNDGK
jgi:NAD(P)-dependent dehydrogenase (short-subunit alcohol dehydrogenase family)